LKKCIFENQIRGSLIEGNGNVVASLLTLFNLISFLLNVEKKSKEKVEKKGKDNIPGGEFVGGIVVGDYCWGLLLGIIVGGISLPWLIILKRKINTFLFNFLNN
jgi:hypothetical protein